MAYDRYDARNHPRDERSRWRDDRFESRGWDRDRGSERDSEDRGFFERAGDEISSWFGDEDAERRRREDRMRDEREGRYSRSHANQDREFRGSSNRDQDEDRGRFWRERTWDSGDFERGEERFRPSGWRSRGRNVERDRDFGRDRGYRPMTGDYGRSEGFFAASGIPRDRFEERRSDFGRSQSPYGRDEYRRTSSAGSSDRSRFDDPQYSSWRQRQLDELDRDYEEYRRENQSRFEDDFGNWRQKRQQKRGLLGQIREQMEVVGNDDQHVGSIDRVAGDRLILTKSDPEAGGVHHSISCSDIDRVEGDRVILDCSAEQAKQRWRDESRSRALFEREDQGEMGPRILDRSFEGTYR